ncbi:MAG: bifunctional 5,10-methylenetetrahydrofolate dehydrogenase/5,10-methenyltetrahydrofolate cyclohydrolase [Promethearchaeota archaeon]
MDKILNGRKLAEQLNYRLKNRIKAAHELTGITPKLGTIQVGNYPSSETYINIKAKTCNEIGIEFFKIQLPENVSKKELLENIEKLNNDDSIHGILLQLPLPEHLKEFTNEFLSKISPNKDADGLHPYNQGKLFNYDETLASCTPKGIITLLEHHNINITGKHVVIINRSNLVGKPLIFMLLKRNATVSVCHSYTVNLESHVKEADILIVAVGIPNFIRDNMIKKGVIIIDVGISKINGKIYGDVNFTEVLPKCAKITPVPGGVGPMTVASLMNNIFTCYKIHMKSKGIEIEKNKIP